MDSTHPTRTARPTAAMAMRTTTKETIHTGRSLAVPMETRGLLAEWDAARGRLTSVRVG